jgi:hypothetical protein
MIREGFDTYPSSSIPSHETIGSSHVNLHKSSMISMHTHTYIHIYIYIYIVDRIGRPVLPFELVDENYYPCRHSKNLEIGQLFVEDLQVVVAKSSSSMNIK